MHGFADDAEFDERQAFSVEEVRELEPLLDFQAHTVTHPILTSCSAEKSAAEIGDSKRELEELGLAINAFTYPNGDYGDREVAEVEAGGYACALTVDAGLNTRETDLFRLKRIAINDAAPPSEVIVKASGIVDLVNRVARSG